jgi:hypothetical protein
MNWIPVQSRSEAERHRMLPVIAVDMGFAGDHNSSCGVAWADGPEARAEMCFGEAVNRVGERLKQDRETVLLIEAPLSGAFSAGGNPCVRGNFERWPQRRYWWVQPGAGIALGAGLFLHRLIQNINSHKGTVHIVEGFVTGVTGQHSHMRVAVALRRAFLNSQTPETYWHSVERNGEIHSVVALVGPDAGKVNSTVSVILKVPNADITEL